MIIQCPDCSARFRLADDKVRVGMKVRCSRCKHVFRVSEDSAVPPEPSPSKPMVAARPGRPNTEDPFGMGQLYGQEQRSFTPAGTPVLDNQTGFQQGSAQSTPGGPLHIDAGKPREALVREDLFARDDPFAATMLGLKDEPEDFFGEAPGSPGIDPFAATGFEEEPAPQPAPEVSFMGGLQLEGNAPPPSADFALDDPLLPRGGFSAGDPDDFMREAVSFEEEPPAAPLPSEDAFAVDSGVFERFGEEPQEEEGASEDAGGFEEGSIFGSGLWDGVEDDASQAQGAPEEEEDQEDWLSPGANADDLFAPPPPEPSLEEPPAPDTSWPQESAPVHRAQPLEHSGVIKPPRAAKVPKRKQKEERPAMPARSRPARPAAPEPAREATVAAAPAPDPPSRSSPSGGLVIAPATVRHDVHESTSLLQSLVNLALILMLVLVGFLGFVAWRNGGLLDFKALGDMTAVAFGRGHYTPRSGAPPAKAAPAGEAQGPADAAPAEPLQVQGLEQLDFPNKKGQKLFVVEGSVVNRSDAPISGIQLQGVVLDAKGQEVATLDAPAGRAVSEEELLDIVDEDSRAAVYARIRESAAAMEIKQNQAMRFSLVFLGVPSQPEARYTSRVTARKAP